MKCEDRKKRLPRGLSEKCDHLDTIGAIFMDLFAFLIDVLWLSFRKHKKVETKTKTYWLKVSRDWGVACSLSEAGGGDQFRLVNRPSVDAEMMLGWHLHQRLSCLRWIMNANVSVSGMVIRDVVSHPLCLQSSRCTEQSATRGLAGGQSATERDGTRLPCLPALFSLQEREKAIPLRQKPEKKCSFV